MVRSRTKAMEFSFIRFQRNIRAEFLRLLERNPPPPPATRVLLEENRKFQVKRIKELMVECIDRQE